MARRSPRLAAMDDAALIALRHEILGELMVRARSNPETRKTLLRETGWRERLAAGRGMGWTSRDLADAFDKSIPAVCNAGVRHGLPPHPCRSGRQA